MWYHVITIEPKNNIYAKKTCTFSIYSHVPVPFNAVWDYLWSNLFYSKLPEVIYINLEITCSTPLKFCFSFDKSLINWLLHDATNYKCLKNEVRFDNPWRYLTFSLFNLPSIVTLSYQFVIHATWDNIFSGKFLKSYRALHVKTGNDNFTQKQPLEVFYEKSYF